MHAASRYTFQLTEAATGCNWNGDTTTTTGAPASCRLSHNSTYCIVVRAQNTHGLWGPRVRSNGIRVCLYGPTAGHVTEWEYPLDVDFNNTMSLPVKWKDFEDTCTPIETYRVELQERLYISGPHNYTHRSSPQHNLAGEWKPLEDRHLYHVQCGMSDYDSHPGISGSSWYAAAAPDTPDPTPMLDGNMPPDAQGCWVEPVVRWPGIHGTYFELPGPGSYRVLVCATNVVRQTICQYSDGYIADVTAPTGPMEVCVGLATGTHPSTPQAQFHATYALSHSMRGTRGESVEPPNRYTVGKLTSMRCEADAGGWLTRTDQVEVHWSGCKDDESGVGEFRWAVGTVAGIEYHMPWTTVGWENEVNLAESIAQASETSGTPLIITVDCFNRAGLSMRQQLGPIRFDTTPPTHGGISVDPSLPLHNDTYWSANDSVAIRFHGPIADLQSGIQHATATIRPLGQSVANAYTNSLVVDLLQVPLESDGVTRIVTLTGMWSRLRYTAYMSVTNFANLTSEAYLHQTFVWDPSPAHNGLVEVCDADKVKQTHQTSTSKIWLCISNFVAPTSKLYSHLVLLQGLTGAAAPDVYITIPHLEWVEIDVTMTHGAYVTITSWAMSGANVAATPISNWLVVDTTPPVPSQVYLYTHSPETRNLTVASRPRRRTRTTAATALPKGRRSAPSGPSSMSRRAGRTAGPLAATLRISTDGCFCPGTPGGTPSTRRCSTSCPTGRTATCTSRRVRGASSTCRSTPTLAVTPGPSPRRKRTRWPCERAPMPTCALRPSISRQWSRLSWSPTHRRTASRSSTSP